MASDSLAWHVRRFPRALGALLTTPGAALREIETRERGGFSVLVGWCLLAAIALRFSSLADAIVGFESGGGLRVVSVLVGELTQAVPVALVAALAVVIGAGARRDPAIDLELGCGVAVPFMITRAAFRAAVVATGWDPPPWLGRVSYLTAGAWALVLLALAIRIARARPRPRGPEPSAREQATARAAGWAAIGVLLIALGGGVLWTARNAERLGPVTRGAPAPDFSLPRVDGKPGALSLASLRGRVVVLDFWATWCPPCLASLPTMHELARELEPRGVTVVGVDSEGGQSSPEEVAAFLREHGAPYPVVYDEGTANESYRIRVLPTIVVVGKQGLVERVFVGLTGKKALAAAAEAALAR